MKYAKALIDVIELEAEDVVLTSGCPEDCPHEIGGCTNESGCPLDCPHEIG